MSLINVTEYSTLAKGSPFGALPSLRSYNLEISPEQVTSLPFEDLVSYIRLLPAEDCRIHIGKEPSVTEESTLLVGGSPEYFGVTGLPGSNLKLGVQKA
jgi:hypothetical protein